MPMIDLLFDSDDEALPPTTTTLGLSSSAPSHAAVSSSEPHTASSCSSSHLPPLGPSALFAGTGGGPHSSADFGGERTSVLSVGAGSSSGSRVEATLLPQRGPEGVGTATGVCAGSNVAPTAPVVGAAPTAITGNSTARQSGGSVQKPRQHCRQEQQPEQPHQQHDQQHQSQTQTTCQPTQQCSATNSIPQRRIYLVPVGLGEKRKKILEGGLKSLGAVIVQGISEATHLVVVEQIAPERVANFLRGLSAPSGAQVVSCAWVVASISAGSFQPATAYLINPTNPHNSISPHAPAGLGSSSSSNSNNNNSSNNNSSNNNSSNDSNDALHSADKIRLDFDSSTVGVRGLKREHSEVSTASFSSFGSPNRCKEEGKKDFSSPKKEEEDDVAQSPMGKRARLNFTPTGTKSEFSTQFFDDTNLDNDDVSLAGKVGSLNTELLAEFESLRAFYASKKSEPWRERQYRKIVAVLKNLPFRITSMEDLRRPQCSVLNGGHTKTRVEEFLRRGKIELAQNLQNDPRTIAVSTLMNFGVQAGKSKYGSYVGSSTAEKWYDSGITTLEQLQHKIESDPTFLTHNQRVMWDFRSDFALRIPRREVELIAEVIAGAFPASSVVEVMGSYSRGAPDCGDIDLLVTCHGDVSRRCAEAVEALTKASFITATLRDSHQTPGAHSGQWMGGCRLASLVPARPEFAEYTLHRRLDIKVYPPKFRAFAQLYFGSGQEFNRAIRLFATRQGYTLSDQGLRRATRGKNEKGDYGTLWEGPLLDDPSGCNWTTEASIFEFLGLPFIPLEDRDNGIGVARLEAMARSQAATPSNEDCFIVAAETPKNASGKTSPLQRLAPLPSLDDGWRSNGIVALDCEFVGVGRNTSGIGGERNALARASVVSYSGDVLLDTFVKVDEPVTDFRIHVTGLTQKNLDQGISYQEARQLVIKLLEGRVVVGHSLAHDFKVLNYHPPAVLLRDTSNCPHLRPGDKGKSLKALSEQHLGVKIQDGTHCSVEDARAALYLYRSVQRLWDPSPPVLGTTSKVEAAEKHLTEAAENMAAPVSTGKNEPLAAHFDRLAARTHHYAKDHYVRVSRTLRSLPYQLKTPKDLLRPELRCIGRGKAHADIVRMLHEGVNDDLA